MITEAEIQTIIRQALSFDSYGTSRVDRYDVERMSKQIASAARTATPKASPAYYPTPGCDCGGERAKAAHASWCGLRAGRVRR